MVTERNPFPFNLVSAVKRFDSIQCTTGLDLQREQRKVPNEMGRSFSSTGKNKKDHPGLLLFEILRLRTVVGELGTHGTVLTSVCLFILISTVSGSWD